MTSLVIPGLPLNHYRNRLLLITMIRGEWRFAQPPGTLVSVTIIELHQQVEHAKRGLRRLRSWDNALHADWLCARPEVEEVITEEGEVKERVHIIL